MRLAFLKFFTFRSKFILQFQSAQPTFHQIFSIPIPIQTDSSPDHEYASVVALDATKWLVSDGAGHLYLLETVKSNQPTVSISGRLLSTYEISSEDATIPSFQLHAAVLEEGHTVTGFVSSKVTSPTEDPGSSTPEPATKKTKLKAARVRFDLFGFMFPSSQESIDEVHSLSTRWRLKGNDPPSWAAYDASRRGFIIAASSPYSTLSTPAPQSAPGPAQDELAPIPRIDAQAPPERPPPYSWTQTSDSITIAFPLPSTTLKSQIHVQMSSRNLTLLIQDPDGHISPPPPSDNTPKYTVPLPRFALKQFWDGIDSSGSFWTWDREGERSKDRADQVHTVGLLTLHLEKQHEGTRWPHVFASVGTGTGLEEDQEVPETVDPSELYLIRESLEKYTASLASGEDTSGLGLGTGVPSLAQGEIDDEIDAKVGTGSVFTTVGLDGVIWKRPGGDSIASVLSFPLPVSRTTGERELISLVIKNDMDGLLYTVPRGGEDKDPQWTHSSTYAVLAFVLASKRDTRFVFHYTSEVVLAFESGSGGTGDMGGNVFLYRNANGKKWAEQAVVKVGGGSAGALLGVAGVHTTDGLAVVCLCERELVIARRVAK
jgi:hypothetical protein